MPQFHVRIETDDLVFSAAHWLVLDENVCEPLHGHDFRVAAEVHGPLGGSGYVVDFLALHAIMRRLVGELDHAVLVPSEQPAFRVAVRNNDVEVSGGGRRWVFPRAECRILPTINTTAELLAQHLAKRLAEELASHNLPRPERLRVEVEEMPGRKGICEL